MKLYIVIPHYIINKHVAELAERAIKSFKETSDCIVVSCDDASPYKHNIKDISDVYIRNRNNKGFAGNVNVGFRYVLEHSDDNDYIVCANNDIEVFDGWFEEFKRILDKYNGKMISGFGYKPRIVNGVPIERFKEGRRELSIGGRFEDRLFAGGFWMMKKDVLDIGLLDEGFIHGGYEDVDFFLRAKQAGIDLIVTPSVVFWHEEGATRFSELEAGIQNDAEIKNREYFKKKHGFDARAEYNNIFTDKRKNL